MKLLLTGFEAFEGNLVNPSKEAVEQMDALPAGTPSLAIADDIRAIRIAVETMASRTIRKNRCLR